VHAILFSVFRVRSSHRPFPVCDRPVLILAEFFGSPSLLLTMECSCTPLQNLSLSLENICWAGIVQSLWTSRCRSPAGTRYFSVLPKVQTAVGPIQPPVHWVPGIKLQGRSNDHSPLCNAEIKNNGGQPPVTKCRYVSRRLPTAAARVQTRVWSCGILWRTKVALGQVSPSTSVSPANLHSICSTIIFTITRGWHNRPGVAAVPIASQKNRIIKK
jgi:hypothetical protein